MFVFEMEDTMAFESKEEIADALREIADAIEDGRERDFIPGEGNQSREWFVYDEDEEDDEEDDDGWGDDDDEEGWDDDDDDDERGW